jgi:enamine deaminase RidA (YjgF/YER057c/UK114 family)
MTPLQRINPPELGPAPSYSQIVITDAGVPTVYISGQVALDADGQVVGVGDLKTQARVVFEHLEAALRAAGAGWNDVVRLNTYLTDIGGLATVREVRERFFGSEEAPGSTLVEVSRLFHPDFLIEVDAIAVVPHSTTPAVDQG